MKPNYPEYVALDGWIGGYLKMMLSQPAVLGLSLASKWI